jgi:hypothetical protein
MAQQFPIDYAERACYLVPINVTLIPWVAGMLQIMERRGFWATDSDYELGYNAIVELESCMMATCLSDLMALQEAQYRMLNTALFGQAYESDEGDPPVITPSIAPFVSTDIISRASVNGRLEDALQLFDNTLNGTDVPNYDNPPSVRVQLQAIIDALAEGTDLTEVLSDLEAIALLLG